MPVSIESEVIVTDLQAAVRECLTSDSWFTGIDVFTPDDMGQDGENKTPGDIEQRIEQSLSSLKRGICVIVVLPEIGSISPDSRGIYADAVPLVVRIVENPLVNRSANGTRKTASMAAVRVMRKLHHFTYRDCVVAVKSAKRIPDENALIWDVTLQTSLNLPEIES